MCFASEHRENLRCRYHGPEELRGAGRGTKLTAAFWSISKVLGACLIASRYCSEVLFVSGVCNTKNGSPRGYLVCRDCPSAVPGAFRKGRHTQRNSALRRGAGLKGSRRHKGWVTSRWLPLSLGARQRAASSTTQTRPLAGGSPPRLPSKLLTFFLPPSCQLQWASPGGFSQRKKGTQGPSWPVSLVTQAGLGEAPLQRVSPRPSHQQLPRPSHQ